MTLAVLRCYFCGSESEDTVTLEGRPICEKCKSEPKCLDCDEPVWPHASYCPACLAARFGSEDEA